MSGTELGRVMAEVTAQPPVDVDFGAIEHLVRRRRRRVGVGAGGTAVAVVALVVGLSVGLQGQGTEHSTAPSAPTGSIPTLAAAWPSHSKDDIAWKVPPGWSVTDMQPDLRRGIGGSSPLALMSTFPTGSSCTKPGDACLLQIPDDGVLARVTVSGGRTTSAPAPADPGSLVQPDNECAGWGGGQSFTSSRSFGTEPFTTVVSVTACLGRTAPAGSTTLLRLVEASVTDASAVTVDSYWQQITLGQLNLRLAPSWSVGVGSAVAGEMLLDSSCLADHAKATAWSCTPQFQPFAASQGVVWVSAVAPPSSPLSKVKYQGSMPATGACAAAGGKYDYTEGQRHLGPQASGELVTVSGCMGASVANTAYQQVTLMLNSMVDAKYPSAAQLCTDVPGAVSSALATVGDMRALKWGTATPAAGIFPNAAAGDDSAWCWVRDDPDKVFNVWAVHSGDAPVKVVDVGLPWFSWGTFAPSVAPISLIASSFYTLGPSPTPVAVPVTPPASSPPPTPTVTPAAAAALASGTTAKGLCASALGTYSTASLTTVGELRSVVWGPGYRPLPHAFPGAAASDAAAWCWKASGGSADIYVVHAGDSAVFVTGDAIGSGPVPSGVPQIP